MLELRSQVSRTSTKKFDALIAHASPDRVVRNCFQMCAAGRTWRWGGRVIQPQNLAKPTKALEGLNWDKTSAGFKIVSGGMQVDCAVAVAQRQYPRD